MKISVANYISKKLHEFGLKYVPVYQGGAVMNMIDEIGKSKKIKYYVPYHEQALSMQVDTLARFNDFAAGFVTSGPGATNLLSGVCCAWYDSIPCLFITGQVGEIHIKDKRRIRQLGFQETDTVSIFKSVTKLSIQIRNANNIGYILDKCFYIAKSGRPGPVHIDIPYNIQRTIIDTKNLKSFRFEQKTLEKKYDQINKNSIKFVKPLCLDIAKSKKPLFLIGGGVKLSKQEKKVLSICKTLKIPFVTTWMTQDITNASESLYLGSIGRSGHRSANYACSESDLIVCLGQRFAVKNILDNFGKKAKIVAIDIDYGELYDGWVKPDIKILTNLNYFVPILEKNLKNKKLKLNNWNKECLKIKEDYYKLKVLCKRKSDREKFVNSYEFFDKISYLIPKNSILFPDAGANQVWFFQAYQILKNQKIINQSGHAPMGHAIPCSIAGYYSMKSKNKKIICFTGDGGLMMNIQELEYISSHNLPIKIVILDNNVLGNTFVGARAIFEGRTHANDIKNGYNPPQTKKVLQGFGFNVLEINNNRNINKIFAKFLNTKKLTALVVKISPYQHPAELHQISLSKSQNIYL